MVTVKVPGTVYRECFDPAATQYPAEAGLPQPTRQKVGKGSRYTYTVTEDQARDMLAHAYDFGVGLSYGVDDTAIGRSVTRWAVTEATRRGLTEGVLI